MILNMTHEEFSKNHKNHTFWDRVIEKLLDQENIPYQSYCRFPMGGNIVYKVNDNLVLKLFAPFDSSEYFIETEVLEKTDWSQVHIDVPQIYRKGKFDGWNFFMMTLVPGELLIDVWTDLSKEERIGVSTQLGRLIREMHGLSVDVYECLDRSFDEWIMNQKKQVANHHQETGLSPSLVKEIPDYVSSFKSTGESVLLTGEYTPFNLLVTKVDDEWTLTGLIDFADCFIGESTYDLLGPILFTFYKENHLTRAFLEGYGMELNDESRIRLMQLLLLHRFSHLPNYLDGQIEMNDRETLESLSRRFFSY